MKSFFAKNPKLLPVFLTVLIYTAIGLFVYVSINKQKTVSLEVMEEKQPDDSLETHPASVYFQVNNGKSVISYYARLDNKHSVLNLMEYHIQKSGLMINRVDYAYGMRIEGINDTVKTNEYEWKFYDNDKEITDNIVNVYLQDEHTYRAVYTKL